jgi:hypothetical protein
MTSGVRACSWQARSGSARILYKSGKAGPEEGVQERQNSVRCPWGRCYRQRQNTKSRRRKLREGPPDLQRFCIRLQIAVKREARGRLGARLCGLLRVLSGAREDLRLETGPSQLAVGAHCGAVFSRGGATRRMRRPTVVREAALEVAITHDGEDAGYDENQEGRCHHASEAGQMCGFRSLHP